MGKLKAFIPIVLALVIAVGGSALIYQYMQEQSTPQQAVKMEDQKITTVPVVVSTTDLAWGTELTKEMIKKVPFLQESLPTGYHSEPEDLVGRILISQLTANEPITEGRLAPEDVTSGGVSAVLESGMRAIAVPGNKVSGISGFIRPGNQVDVLVTMEDPDSEEDITKLVLEKIPVLATGTQIQEGKNGEPSPVDVYTLKVSPEEAEKLTLASSRGKLQFALRNIKDQESVLTEGANIADTLDSLKVSKPKPIAKASPRRVAPRQVYTVEVINGENRATKSF
jgi:pilus assembly protein CpaB